MYLLFIAIIVILFIGFFILILENLKIIASHQKELIHLNDIITELRATQSTQNGIVLLSDALICKLNQSRVEIDKKMLNLQNDLIEKMIDNSLIE